MGNSRWSLLVGSPGHILKLMVGMDTQFANSLEGKMVQNKKLLWEQRGKGYGKDKPGTD